MEEFFHRFASRWFASISWAFLFDLWCHCSLQCIRFVKSVVKVFTRKHCLDVAAGRPRDRGSTWHRVQGHGGQTHL